MSLLCVLLSKVMRITLSFFRVQEHGGEQIIPFSCALERNLADMPPDEVAKYCEENKVQRLVHLNFVYLSKIRG